MHSFIYNNILGPFRIAPWPLLLVVFFFSVVIHEVAHGIMASHCGDDTAKLMGRITLNPIPHIDPIGTILVPILLILFKAPFVVGWAKPVPINPYNFNNYKEGTLKVSSAGVLTNFAFAIVLAAVVWVMHLTGLDVGRMGFYTAAVLSAGVAINVVLGLFNLIPIPPLDGSRIVSVLLPPELSEKYDRMGRYGFIILILLLNFIFPVLIGIANIFYNILFWGIT
ncbi:MAG: site-2 protease family protein [Elusimicrobia bacterium]|jgi:Zn-dependent protease|nr:site-2 protease family protein [Elusimicrobiota bacterium]